MRTCCSHVARRARSVGGGPSCRIHDWLAWSVSAVARGVISAYSSVGVWVVRGSKVWVVGCEMIVVSISLIDGLTD